MYLFNNVFLGKAEDEKVKEYKININRKEKEEIKEEFKTEEKDPKFDKKKTTFVKKSILLSIGIDSLSIIIFVIV